MSELNARPAGASHKMNAHLDGARLIIETELAERGRKVGVESGHRVPDAATERRLSEEARTAAARYAGRGYDPEGSQADRMYRDEYDRNLKRREDREQMLLNAEIALRDQKALTAQVPRSGERPVINALVLVFGVAGVALSVGLALNDAIFAHWFTDSVRAGGASVIAGLLVGAIPTFGMLFGAVHTEAQERWEGLLGFAVGLMFGFAVYGLRVWSANGDWTNAVAWALALMEIVTVLVVKLYAVSLHREVQRWAERDRARAPAENAEVTKQAHVDELRQQIQDLHDRAEAHRKRAGEGEDLTALVPILEQAAVAAVLNGYQAAVEANNAHVLGSAHLARRP